MVEVPELPEARADEARAALAARLRAVQAALLPNSSGVDRSPPVQDATELLDAAVRAVRQERDPASVWLLLVAISATFPSADFVEDAVRQFELLDVVDATIWLLDRCLASSLEAGSALSQLILVDGGTVIDVNHAARNNYHTGIQQVIRSTMPCWNRDHEIVLAAWMQRDHAFRPLDVDERSRVLEWHGRPSARIDDSVDRDRTQPIIVPWNSVVVLLDTPVFSVFPRLQGLAQYSGNSVVAVGYDCIPFVSPQYVPIGAADRNARYLSLVKYMDRISGISASAAAEFQGFVTALKTQGLRGPVVLECELPSDSAQPRGYVGEDAPMVLCVGSLEPRKNHLALLSAAEQLWRDGLEFELMFIGGMSWSEDTHRRVDELKAVGRAITIALKVDDTILVESYRRARFTVFPSLHEGYGLPVAESLAAGTPVITSNYGSTAQIARTGGALTVDPRSDGELVEAMRALLADDVLLDQLRAQTLTRPGRTWDEYAATLWDQLVAAELSAHRSGQ